MSTSADGYFLINFSAQNIEPNTNNSVLVYNFPNSIRLENKLIALSSVSLYYCWPNISAALKNNTFSYKWTNNITYDVVIPDGLYEVVALNKYFQSQMKANGCYLIDENKADVFYASLIIDINRYAVVIQTTPVPIALPAGYTAPSNFAGYTTDGYYSYPTVIIPAGFNKLIGFPPDFQTGNRPTGAKSSFFVELVTDTTLSYYSTQAPNLQSNSTVLFVLDGVKNTLATNAGLIYSFTPTVSAGALANTYPPQLLWCKLQSGAYNQLRLSILGTDYLPMNIPDPNMSLTFCIRDPN